MLKNHLWSAARQFRKNPFYSSLNILGLAVGTACFLLIVLWVEHETGYDRALPNADRVYRVTTDVHLSSGQNKSYAFSTSGLAPALKADYPEVVGATRLMPRGQVLLRHGDASFFERDFMFVDADFFAVFPRPLAVGDPSAALKRPNSLLLTREMAGKYFGDEDPIGKTVTVNNADVFVVTGILENPRSASHIRLDFVANPGDAPGFKHSSWTQMGGTYTYIEIAKTASPQALEAKIQDLATKYVGPQGKELFTFRLQPVVSIHFHSDREGEYAAVVGVAQVRLLSTVAALVLLVAGINFINLSTARAGRRAREVGVRKVLGAERGGLFRQFLCESFLSTLVAFGFGLILAGLALPWFNALWGESLRLGLGRHALLLVSLASVVGLLAGSYPALVLSSFRPGLMLKEARGRGKASALLRQALIIFQYSAGIVLLISTAVVARQMSYLRAKGLGFDKGRVLAVRLRSPDIVRNIEAVKHEFLQDPDIVAAAAASSPVGIQADVRVYAPEGSGDTNIAVRTIFVDYDFISALGMKVAAGRAFSREFPTDASTALVINRTAQIRFGWTEAVGKKIVFNDHPNAPESAVTARVVGVVEDFHIRSLHQEVEPVILRIQPHAFQFLFLKLRGMNLDRTRSSVEEKMKTLQPGYPPETRLLDDMIDNLYGNEDRLGRIFSTFSLVTILVACLGLLGLAAYDAEQRTKEIGIRKVLGATTPRILWLLTHESARLVVLANLVAWPVGFVLMQNWLRNFAYRISVGPIIMVLSGAAALAVALITVGVQAYRAASADPVRSLRYE
jgi:putative ABC transport system permease protein